jgi:SAM-dependent methyltransferase
LAAAAAGFTLGDRVSLQLHTETLRRRILPAGRVLDIGAGPGRFTEVLASLGCQIVVGDISSVQLDLNRARATERGFATNIESWQQLDVCDLQPLESGAFDAVVAYGGPLSYALDRRDQALAECIRVLRPEGVLALSVMCLWGATHRHLPAILQQPPEINARIMATGDLDEETNFGSGHYCHMFRAAELVELLRRHGLTIELISASSALSTGLDAGLATTPERWRELMEWERTACVEPGNLDAGTHLIAMARR